MENKKIKNNKCKEYNGIKFRSQLDYMAYKTLKDKNLDVSYEVQKFTIWKGQRQNVKCYSGINHKLGLVSLKGTKLRDMTYTPDLFLSYNNCLAIIEMKGFENDIFPIKKKLFMQYLNTIDSIEYNGISYDKEHIFYFEIQNKRQIETMLLILKNYNE